MASSVLIVEDEAVVALDLQRQLVELGYDVLGVAERGEHAIDLVERAPPNLVLMDVRLRGELDGIDAASAIRERHDIPVIFLTSYSDDETVQRAARTAPYGYLTKPYQVKELRAGIEVALMKSRLERRLREADRWFAHALQCVADGVILTDLNARVRFVNPAAEALTGWPLAEAAGRDLAEIVRFCARRPSGSNASSSVVSGSAPVLDDPTARVRAVLASGRPLPVDHAIGLLARDGTRKIVDETAGPVDDDMGKRLGAVLVLRDAAERVAQEAQLRSSEERFRAAFDHAPLGMALVSLGGEFIQVNEALCRLLGGPAEELRRRGNRELTSADDEDHERQRLQQLTTSVTGVVQFEKRYLRLDGSEPIWTLASVSLIHEGDRPSCYLYQVHDLTAQKRAADQLAELAAERLRREASELANESRIAFMSRVSHELRTPLNAVIGFAQLLQLTASTDPTKTTAYAGYIHAAGEHLLVLVNDLLDLNRAAQGTLKMSLQPVVLADVVNDSVQLLHAMGQAHGVDISASVPPSLVVVADPTRLRQVLLNVASNAIKYNRQSGSVHLEASAAGAARARLSIEDTGIGMTSEQLERLFRPFDRLGQELTKIPGTGLGLVIARSLVVEMGGTLEVRSRPRAGTTVVIELAVAAAGSAPAS